MQNKKNDQVIVQDLSSRRTFIRTGAAFLLASAAVTSRKPVYANDCDRGLEGEKNAEQAGSDSDSGEGADRAGCGRGKPAITRRATPEPMLGSAAIQSSPAQSSPIRASIKVDRIEG